MATYTCPDCGEEIIGEDFGGDAYCPDCKMYYETDYELTGEGDAYGFSHWIIGNGIPADKYETENILEETNLIKHT